MKFLLLAISLASTFTYANTSVQTGLELQVSTTSWGYTGHPRKYGKCSGRSDDHHSFSDQGYTFRGGNGEYTGNFNAVYRSLFTVSASGVSFDYVPRIVTVGGRITNGDIGGIDKVQLTIQDVRNPVQGFERGGECDEHHFGSKTTKETISGFIRLKYKMPVNTWAVRLVRGEPGGGFRAATYKPNAGMLTMSPEDHLSDSVVIWAAPDSEWTMDIVFPQFDAGKTIDGTLYFEIQPMAMQEPKSLNDFNVNLLSQQGNSIKLSTLEEAFFYIQNPEGRMSGIIRSRVESARKLGSTLFQLAQSPYLNKDNKILFTILSYSFAKDLLHSIVPYCQSFPVDIPFQDKPEQVSYARMVYYLVNRSLARVGTYSVTRYREFLQELKHYENRSYAEVSSDIEARKKIEKAYKVLNLGLENRISSLKLALEDLNYQTMTTKKLIVRERDSNDLTSLLSRAVSLEKAFLDSFFERMQLFAKNYPQKVKVSDLLSNLDQLEATVKKTAIAFKTDVRLLTTTQNPNDDVVVKTLFDFLADQIGAFSKATTLGEFEPLRTSFVSTYSGDISKIKSESKGCGL